MSNFEEIARRLSKRESIVSDIIPNIRFIKIYMTKAASKGIFGDLGSTIAALNNSIETRCSNYINDKNVIIATFLDPRFKNKMFDSSNADGWDLGTSTGIEMLLSLMLDTLD